MAKMNLCAYSGSYWLYLGIFYLIWLTYQDFNHKRMVDDRKNYFMMGATIILIVSYPQGFIYLLSLIIITIGLSIYLKKFKPLGEADINSMGWIFFGFGMINLMALFWFMLVFISLSIIYFIVKMYIFKYKEPTAFYPVILISFSLTSYIIYLLGFLR